MMDCEEKLGKRLRGLKRHFYCVIASIFLPFKNSINQMCGLLLCTWYGKQTKDFMAKYMWIPTHNTHMFLLKISF